MKLNKPYKIIKTDDTSRAYGVTGAMLEMIGNTYGTTINSGSKGRYALIDGFRWAEGDLQAVKKMPKNKLNEGDRIKICSNPEKSINAFGAKQIKMRLANSIQTVAFIRTDGVAIKYEGSYYKFCFGDFDKIELLKPKKMKPEFFDPTNLVV